MQLTFFLIFGAAAGLLAVFVATGSEPTTYVARAEQGLAAGQILDLETWGGIDVVPLPPDAVESGAFSGETVEEVLDQLRSTINGEATLYPVSAGQQLRPQQFTGSGSGTPVRGLQPDERHISVTARAARAVAGTIRPELTSMPSPATGLLVYSAKMSRSSPSVSRRTVLNLLLPGKSTREIPTSPTTYRPIPSEVPTS
jgi:hypothetical protein